MRQTPTNTAKIERAVVALVTHGTIAKAARAIKTSPRNFSRYTREPEFERLYREAKGRLIREVTRRLTANAIKAVDVLREIFDDRKATPGARVAACSTTIGRSYVGYEVEELEERIIALEEKKNASF